MHGTFRLGSLTLILATLPFAHPAYAAPMPQDRLPLPCPMVIGITADGTLRTNRFQGWVRTSPTTLESDLKNGCYPEGGPRPVSSVQVLVSRRAAFTDLVAVLDLLQRGGWSKDKLTIATWDNAPKRPAVPPR